MVAPADVPKVVLDAAYLVKVGEIVVFGSGALAYWLQDAPSSNDVDLLVSPPDRAEMVEALMGELSWYHERHGVYVEVPPASVFAAPGGWRERARRLDVPEHAGVTLVVPHPHDVLLSKLERFHDADRDHARRILTELPLSLERLDALADGSPYRQGEIVDEHRIAAFEHHLARVRRMASELA